MIDPNCERVSTSCLSGSEKERYKIAWFLYPLQLDLSVAEKGQTRCDWIRLGGGFQGSPPPFELSIARQWLAYGRVLPKCACVWFLIMPKQENSRHIESRTLLQFLHIPILRGLN